MYRALFLLTVTGESFIIIIGFTITIIITTTHGLGAQASSQKPCM